MVDTTSSVDREHEKQTITRRVEIKKRVFPYHEVPNGPVEDCSIVVAFFTQTDKVLSSFGNLVNKGNKNSSATDEIISPKSSLTQILT